MKQLHRIVNQLGFTLAETLLAVLILLLVSGLVATGIPVAKNVYDKTIVAANAQALLSTTVAALKDELGTAWDVDVKTDRINGEDINFITYYSADTGNRARIYIDDTTKNIIIQDYAEVDGLITKINENKVGEPHPLVSDKTATDKLYITLPISKDIIQDDNTLCIENIEVCKKMDSSASSLAQLKSLVIRPISIHNSNPDPT